MMNAIIIDLLFGLTTLLVGAFSASLLFWSYFRRKAMAVGRVDAHHAARVLDHLQELASRVAFDVDQHNDQVEELNATLISAKNHEPKMIVDVVAKLIEANQQMHVKLASTEDKLREQAVEIQTQAAEARTDALTLLVNRRAFDDELTRRCAEFLRQGHAFSLIMADVDNFKEFNDMHGHLTGDDVLRGVAKVLRRKMREMDLVARYGGEEFAMILPGINLSDAEQTAFRACESVEKSQFNHDGKDLQVTMSFGVAEVMNCDDGVALVARADKALYSAKANGRNCVYRHDGEAIHRSIPKKQLAPFKAVLQQPSELHPDAAENGEKLLSDPNDETAETQEGFLALENSDLLLDLPNRSGFCQQVRHRTAEWKRGGPTFSIVLIEVNQYDMSDGRCSRRAREVAMLAATKFLTATVREMDVLGLYAPGCFALLLPTATLVNAIRLTERLREGFSHFNASAEGKQSCMTLSIGVVQIREDDDSISVLKRAEAALDAADRRGGDRAYCHDGKRCAPITAMLETLDYLS
jgi:diguanylate cyclase